MLVYIFKSVKQIELDSQVGLPKIKSVKCSSTICLIAIMVLELLLALTIIMTSVLNFFREEPDEDSDS